MVHLKTARNTYNLGKQDDETPCSFCLEEGVECMFNPSAPGGKRCELCSVFGRRVVECSGPGLAAA